jgi:hypothetical protein
MFNTRSSTPSLIQTMTRELYPKTVKEMLEWAMELWTHHGIYSQALQRSVLYFMTEVELEGGGDFASTLKREYTERLRRDFNIDAELAEIGFEYVGFGNSFVTVAFPFIRSLQCKKCGAIRHMRDVHGKFDLTAQGEFKPRNGCIGENPKVCTHNGVLTVLDVADAYSKSKVMSWPPQYMSLQVHPISKRKIISLRVREYTDLCDGIRNKDPMYLEDTEIGLIEAAMKGTDFEFDTDRVRHLAAPAVAYEKPYLKGWGKPLFMNEFEDAVMLKVLDRYNEIILSDGLCPFRVISPPAQVTGMAGAGDPMLQVASGDFVTKAATLLAAHRNNPSGYNFFPFPLQYQTLGGDAKQLTPLELIEHQEGRLLRGLGVPTEFVSGSIHSVAGTIISFRMYERFWGGLVKELNNLVDWLVAQQGAQWRWEEVTAKLIPISMLEDEGNKMMKMDLMNSGRISQESGLAAVGLDATRERQLMMAEQERIEEEMMEQQKRMAAKAENMQAIQTLSAGGQVMQQEEQEAQAAAEAQAAQGGGAPPPMPMPGGGVITAGPQGATLDDLMAQAQQMGQQLFSLDEVSRRRELQTLKHTNETLYNQVKGVLEEIRKDAALQGVHMARQQGQPPI